MATYKRVDGDYNIVTVNAPDRVTIETHTLEIQGNLDVTGNLTYINVSELNISDPFIVLNSSNTDTYLANAGVLTHIDSTTFAGIRYNTDSGEWEVSTNTGTSGETGTWIRLATGNVVSAAAGANTQIQYNNSGNFGASDKFSFTEPTGQLQLDGYQSFFSLGISVPAAVIDGVSVYHTQDAGGGTGLYVRTATSSEELISKAKAIAYSIIF
jgi:hypothetical protein